MNLEVERVYKEFIYIVFLFFTMAFFGGMLETIFTYIFLGKFILNGFMYGPLRPIYGFGSLLIYFITKRFDKNPITIFTSCSIICSIFEYLSSFVLELIFKRRWWNYAGMFLNINGRICFGISLLWGIIGVFFIKIVEPVIKRRFNSVDIGKMTIYMLIVFILYKVDTFYSFINNLN